jgi:hypothetical protein
MDPTAHSNRRSAWVPPPRPEWVARINAEGRHLDIKGIVPLDAASLIATATANTGLTNFGDDNWRAPFEVICRGLDAEADLTLIGRILTRSDMLMLLEGRLRIEAAYRQHPEIEREQIESPVLIVGQGRSGTSALFNLLAADPQTIVPRTWQAMLPGLPSSDTHPDPRAAIADRRITMWNRITPELTTAHEFTGDIPTENIHFEALSFRSPSWQALYGQTPSHYQFMAGKSMVPALAYGKRALKLLQWRQPSRQWIMKSPDALTYLPDLLQVYPDIRLVWIHRDPVVSLSSMVSLVGTLAWVRSDRIMSEGTFEAVADPAGAARMLSQPIDWIEAGIVPAERLHNIHYADFVADPMRVVVQLYERLGRVPTADGLKAMQAYLDDHPRSARAAHQYDLGASATIAAERAAFRRYQDYFNVPSEF